MANSPEHYMQYCLQLAKQALGNTKTNPMVGCVIVYQNKITAQGYHEAFGKAHAEVNAFNQIADKTILSECDVYVNLEPCNFAGKTPACCDLFEQNPCKNLYVGMKDPNPMVAGKGIERLKKLGVNVIENILEKECIALNKAFIKSITSKKPYVIAKWAQSKDKFIGKIDQRIAISNAFVNLETQKWRNQIDAYLVGNQTLKIDNPKLTVRELKGRNPVRVVIGDVKSFDYELFNDDAAAFCFGTTLTSDKSNIQIYKETNLEEVLEILYQNHIGTLMIEGGSKTLQSFLDAKLIDEIRCITANNLILKEGIAAPTFDDFELLKTDQFSDNTIQYFIKK